MEIKLSDHFTTSRLLKFALPSILMMVFSSIYGVVDGYFVSNYAGKTAFAAVNFIMPFLMILGELGFMVGTGGCALIGLKLGEQKKEEANGIFSMLIYFTVIAAIIIAVIGFFTMRDVAVLLGADAEMADLCELYGRIGMIGLPALMLQFEFQSLFIVAEKPKLGFYATLIAGCMNMVLDWLFVGILGWGIAGAAAATVASQIAGGVIPLIYFSRDNDSLLRLGRPVWNPKNMVKTLGNGSSEFVSGISMSIVSMLYNARLMTYLGEDGVSAYGVLMYVNFIFIAIFIGYSVGTAPIISYDYGAGNTDELHNVFTRSLKVLGVFSVLMLLAGQLLAEPLSRMFVGYDEGLMELTVHAFRIVSFVFLVSAIPIYGSSFFTALNDGLTSALISFLRTLVFQVVAVIVFPLIFGVDGIWYSVVAADIVAAIITVIFWIAKKEKYHY